MCVCVYALVYMHVFSSLLVYNVLNLFPKWCIQTIWNIHYSSIITEPCQVEICIVQRLTMDSNEREADCLSTALSVNTATSPATIAAKDILYSEALPLSKPVKLTLLPKSDM